MRHAIRRLVMAGAVLGLMAAAAGRAEASHIFYLHPEVDGVRLDTNTGGSANAVITSTTGNFVFTVQAYSISGSTDTETFAFSAGANKPADALLVNNGTGTQATPITLTFTRSLATGTSYTGSVQLISAVSSPNFQADNGNQLTNPFFNLTLNSIAPAAVPEPATIVSAGIAGLIGLGYAWRRRKAKPAA